MPIRGKLDELAKIVKLEEEEIADVEELFSEVLSNLKKIEKELKAIEKKEKKGHELKEEERIILNYGRYVEKLERAFNIVRNLSEKEVLPTINEVKKRLEGNIDRSVFQNTKTKIEVYGREIIGVIERLKDTTKKYGEIFEKMRYAIVYEVKNVCRKLLEIEREVKEAEKTEVQARAS